MQRQAAGCVCTGSGIEDDFDERKMFRQARRVIFAGTRSARFGQGRQQLGYRLGGGKAAVCQDQFELRGVESFAARAENAAHQRIDLLAQERVLLLRGQERGFQRDDACAQLDQFGLWIGAHRARDPIDAGTGLFKEG